MRTLLIVLTLAALALMPLQRASAQDGALGGAIIGGGLGAIIGGAASGKAGGAVAGGIIGAATGAMIGSQMEPRRHGYYYYREGCWQRWPDGSYHRVSWRYCR
jgi:outer membrane lipoprotein SlyB